MAFIASSITAALCLVLAQLPGTSDPILERVHVSSGVKPETASPGDSVTLSVEITPTSDVRLFGLGAKDFTPVALLLKVPKGVSLGKPKYPIPERQSVPGTNKRVPVYDGRVELEQPITISKAAKPGDTLTIDGVVTYQSCDERVTYRRESRPVTFTVRIQ
jgi:hypothetical protein